VLHVLTRAFNVGGDSRLAWRWIEQDAGRRHSVVLTRQGALPLPPRLVAAVDAVGGAIAVLNGERGGLRQWARRLRSLAATADMVVLHTHPYDVIPSLAFGHRPGRPPVIYVNHADHVFWVGVGACDVVANLRASGARLSLARRGAQEGQNGLLPTLIGPIARTLTRSEAKARLGLDAESIVLLSIARPHKYRPLGQPGFGPDFLESVEPILARCPRATLVVIGPGDGPKWSAAHARTGGRVRVIEQTDETTVYYQAADIYLDSYPIVSITSLLEAGAHGAVVVSRCPDHLAGTVIGADMPGLDNVLLQAGDERALQKTLISLIADPRHREALGEQTRREVTARHSGHGWQQALEQIYVQAAQQAATTTPVIRAAAAAYETSAVDRLLPLLFAEEPDLQHILQFHMRLLPPGARLAAWLAMVLRHRRFLPGLLLPEWVGTAIERHRQGSIGNWPTADQHVSEPRLSERQQLVR
jgi:glycosyltransferase involved in cell wall biosynthesis